MEQTYERGMQQQIFGKYGELFLLGKLLEKGYETYVPVVDRDGCDALVLNKTGKYVRVQMKCANTFSAGEGTREYACIRFKGAIRNYNFDICLAVVVRGDEQIIYVIPRSVIREGLQTLNIIINPKRAENLYSIFKDRWDLMEVA